MTRTDNAVRAQIPLPIQIVIDDVGWWSGRDESTLGGPYRTGIARDHVPADYAAIVSLGKQLKMKPQAAFVLCEWDKHNLLRRLPSCNWMGADWDNSRWVGSWQEEAAHIVREGAAHLELALHGVGHEFWSAGENGQWRGTRAEWHDMECNMRPREGVLARLDLFGELLDQHDLGAFPTSYAVPAARHRFANDGNGLASFFKNAGINFISTPFFSMRDALRAQPVVDFDDGVMTVDRGPDIQAWPAIGTPPEGDFEGAICGIHWPNILHPDPARNEEIVRAWVLFLQKQEQRLERMLAPDTAAFATQLIYHSPLKRVLTTTA